MTNNENWVKNNSEVETEEKENGAVVLTGAAEEQIVEDENTSDDVVEVVDEASGETEDEVADDATNDETAETEEFEEETEEEEISDENSEDENTDSEEETKEGMSRTEKIVLTVLALILFLLLVWFGIKVYNNIQRGAGDAHNLNNTQITSSQNDKDSDNDKENGENDGANDGIVDDQNDGEDDSDENTGKRPGNTSSNKTNSDEDGDNDDGNGKKDNSSTDSTDDGKNDNDDVSNGDDDGNGGKGDSDEDDNDDNGNNKDDVVSEYAGETKVRITKVNDETGIITVTVDGEKIVVPVQTTVFNGRVTKSGVAQGKLFGFNCGATVMLFYPQEGGMGNTEFSGYMNRTGDSLTILVDTNGSNSKLLIKINGLKSL